MVCIKCKEDLPETEFYSSYLEKHWYSCKKCDNKRRKLANEKAKKSSGEREEYSMNSKAIAQYLKIPLHKAYQRLTKKHHVQKEDARGITCNYYRKDDVEDIKRCIEYENDVQQMILPLSSVAAYMGVRLVVCKAYLKYLHGGYLANEIKVEEETKFLGKYFQTARQISQNTSLKLDRVKEILKDNNVPFRKRKSLAGSMAKHYAIPDLGEFWYYHDIIKAVEGEHGEKIKKKEYLIPIKDVAEVMGVTYATARSRLLKHDLPFKKRDNTTNKPIRYSEEDLENFYEQYPKKKKGEHEMEISKEQKDKLLKVGENNKHITPEILKNAEEGYKYGIELIEEIKTLYKTFGADEKVAKSNDLITLLKAQPKRNNDYARLLEGKGRVEHNDKIIDDIKKLIEKLI